MLSAGISILSDGDCHEWLGADDLAIAGNDPIASGVALLGHELAEQAAKQFLELDSDSYEQYRFARSIGIVAQNLISGYTRELPPSGPPKPPVFTGKTSTVFHRGGQKFTVTIIWKDGNIVKIK